MYELNGDQINLEKSKNLHVSDSRRAAIRFVSRNQARMHLLNKTRRDKNRIEVAFKRGQLVLKYDKSHDTQGVAKFQFRFTEPMVVEAKVPNTNLYWVRDLKTNKREKVNVNKLVPAYDDLGDLGPPLGQRAEDNQTKTEKENYDTWYSGKDHENHRFQRGHLVALKVDPNKKGIPFSVGKITNIQSNGKLEVQWFGTYGTNIKSCVWRQGFHQHSTKQVYYADKKLHSSHPIYTSKEDIDLDTKSHILSFPFHLTEDGRVPMMVLRYISKRDQIEWKLPQELDCLEYVNACNEVQKALNC